MDKTETIKKNGDWECSLPSKSFGDWLRKRIHEDSPVGDLARDYTARNGEGEKCCSHFISYKGLKKHMIRSHSACQGAMDALERANKEYISSLNK